MQCLNDLVTNALIHAEDCLQYMSALKDLSIFRFAAIPQVRKKQNGSFQDYSTFMANLIPGFSFS